MPSDPDTYVNKNEDALARIIKHSSNDFARALALAALVEFGDEPTIETVKDDLNRLSDYRNGNDERDPRN